LLEKNSRPRATRSRGLPADGLQPFQQCAPVVGGHALDRDEVWVGAEVAIGKLRVAVTRLRTYLGPLHARVLRVAGNGAREPDADAPLRGLVERIGATCVPVV